MINCNHHYQLVSFLKFSKYEYIPQNIILRAAVAFNYDGIIMENMHQNILEASIKFKAVYASKYCSFRAAVAVKSDGKYPSKY